MGFDWKTESIFKAWMNCTSQFGRAGRVLEVVQIVHVHHHNIQTQKIQMNRFRACIGKLLIVKWWFANIVYSIHTLIGNMQTKKNTTTVAIIVTTCFLERNTDALSAITFKIRKKTSISKHYLESKLRKQIISIFE